MAKEKLTAEFIVQDKSEETLKKIKKSLNGIDEELKKIETQSNESGNALNNAIKGTGEASGKSNRALKGLLGSMSSFGAIAKGFIAFKTSQAILGIGKAALQASSDVEELKNVTEQVFGNLSNEVESTARNVAAQIGRSTYSLTKYTSEIGAVISGLGNFDTTQVKEMSEQLAVLAVDIASFKNISDDQAFTALVSGITGETESLKRLGIVINDTALSEFARQKGIKESWATLDQQTKTELRYQAILEKTKIIQGDAARTIDSYANQLKVAQANTNNLLVAIGEKIKPAASSFLGAFNSITGALNDFLQSKGADGYILKFVTAKNQLKDLGTEYIKLSKQKLESGLSNEKEQERLNLYNELISKFPELKSVISSEGGEWNKVSNAIGEVIAKLKEKTLTELKSNFTENLLKEAQKVQAVVDNQIVQATKNINSLEANINNGKFANNLANNKELVNKIATLIAKDRQSGNSVGKNDTYLNTKIDKLLQTVEGYDASVKRNQGTIIDFIIKQGGVNATISNAEKSYQNKVNELKGKFDNDFKTAQNALDRLEKNDGGLFNTVNTVKSDTKELTNLITTANENILDTTGDIRQDVITSKVAILNKLDKISGKLNLSTLKNNISVEKQSDGKVLVVVKDIKSGKLKNNYTFQNVDNAQAFANEILNKEQEEYLRNNPNKKIVATKTERPKLNGNKISSSSTVDSKKKELTELEKILQDLNNQVASDTIKVTKQEVETYNKIKDTLELLYNNDIQEIDSLAKNGILKPLDALKEQLKVVENNLSKNKEYYSKTSDKTFLDRYNDLLQKKKELENKITSSESLEKIEEQIDKFANPNKTNLTDKELEKATRLIKEFQAKQTAKIESDSSLNSSQRAKKFEELSNQIKNLYLNTGEVVDKLSLDLKAQTERILSEFDKNKKSFEIRGLEGQIDDLTKAVTLFNDTEADNKLIQENFSKNKSQYLEILKSLVDTELEPLITKLMQTEFGNHTDAINEFISSRASEGKELPKSAIEVLNTLKETNDSLKRDGAKLNSEASKQAKIQLAETVGSITKNITNTVREIADTFGSNDSREIVGEITKFVDEMIDFGLNLTEAITTLNPQSIIKAVQSFVSLAIDLAKGIYNVASGVAYTKAKEEYKKEEQGLLLSNTKAINELNDSIKTLNQSVLKRASENTSNRALEFNKKLREEYNKSFASHFDSDIKSTSVEKRRLYLNPAIHTLGAVFGGGLITGLATLFTAKNTNKKGDIKFSKLFENIGGTSQELEKFYNDKLKNFDIQRLKSSQEGYDANYDYKNIKGAGIYKEYDIVSTNIEEIKKDFLKHIDQVKQLEQQQKQFTRDAVLNSFEGVNVLGAEEQKAQILEDFKKTYANTEDFDKRYKELQERVDELIKGNENIVNAFDDVRQSTIQNLAKGNSAIESLASGLQSYFDKLKTNIAKVKYDGVFRGLEAEFNDAFGKISQKLADIRVGDKKDLKDLGKDLDFSTLFNKLKATESINNDIKDVVTVLRQQAKAQGLSEEYVNLLFPIEDIKGKILDVRDTLARAMETALNTNSFDQFSFSLGDSLYKSVKDSLIKAFSESEAYKNIFDKYVNTDEYKEQLSKAKTFRESYDILQEQLLKTEDLLKANGLGFRETNGVNGEYLGGLVNGARDSVGFGTTASLQGVGGGINIEMNITNNGYLSTENIAEDMVKKVLERLKEKEEREV